MTITYNVLNDYSLETMTAAEFDQFEKEKPGLKRLPGQTKGKASVGYKNRHGELVYVEVESAEDLDGYEIHSYRPH